MLLFGDLDSAFDSDGLVTRNIGSYVAGSTTFQTTDSAVSVAIQPLDNKIVVVGKSSGLESEGVILRHASTGALDTTFDGDGILPAFANSSISIPSFDAVAIQDDGKIIVAGGVTQFPGNTFDFPIIRLNANGSTDTTFGLDIDGDTLKDGINHFLYAGNSVRKIIIDDQDRILVLYGSYGLGGQFRIARLLSNGLLDTSFGTGGIAQRTFRTRPDPLGIHVEPSGKIQTYGIGDLSSTVNGSPVGPALVLAQWNDDGTPDTTFGQDFDQNGTPDGYLLTDLVPVGFDQLLFTPNDARIERGPGGKLVATVPTSSSSFAVLRFNANGSLDTSFDSDGRANYSTAGSGAVPTAVLVQPDGSVIVGATLTTSGQDGEFGTLRYTSTGTLDSTWGVNGVRRTDFAGGSDTANSDSLTAMVFDNNSLLVAVGQAGIASQGDLGVARYTTGIPVTVGLDADGDGVQDSVENGVDGNGDGTPDGDGDQDGTPDRQQNRKASLPSAVGGKYVTVVLNTAGATIANVAAVDVASPASIVLPIGMFEFDITGLAAGASAGVTMLIHGGLTSVPTSPMSVYKFGSTASAPTDNLYEFPFDIAAGTGGKALDNNQDGKIDRIELLLVDGGAGDDDLTANGSLHDPFGPGYVAAQGTGPGISGTKFFDVDSDGVQDPGEPGLSGWTIFLDEDGDNSFDPATELSQITDGNGDYTFSDLPHSTYTVAEVLQPGWLQTNPSPYAAASPATTVVYDEMAIGQFVGDANLDLLVADRLGAKLLQGSGNGVFAAPTTVSFTLDTTGVEGITSGDWDGDGDLDAAVIAKGNATFAELVVLTNQGGGTLAATPLQLSSISTYKNITAADVSGDGRPDLVVTNLTAGKVEILLNNGSGTFTLQSTVIPAGTEPFEIIAADLDNDTDVDLVVSNTNNSQVNVLKNSGGGVFAAPVAVNTGASPGSMAFVDFDGDALQDLAVAESGAVRILRNTGGAFVSVDVLVSAGSATSLQGADMDGDGDLDLIAATGGEIEIFFDSGSRFGAHILKTVSPALSRVAVGSFGGGSKLDLVAGQLFSDKVTVLVDRLGTFSLNYSGALISDVNFGNLFPGAGEIRGHALTDTNGDGIDSGVESPIDGLTFFIDANGNDQYDVGERFDVSDSAGEFSFAGLAPGQYRIGQAPASGWVRTSPKIVNRFVVDLAAEEIDTSPLFLNTSAPGEIVGTVANDDEADGNLTGDGPQAGVRVYLDLNNNSVWDTVTEPSRVTDAAGAFSFAGLAGGTYLVRMSDPTRTQTFPVSPSTANSVNIVAGVTRTVSFGISSLPKITGVHFNDLDGDGVRDAGEPPVAGVTVFIDANNNHRLDVGERSTVTSADGSYTLIPSLIPGTYTIAEVQRKGWQPTTPAGGEARTTILTDTDIDLVQLNRPVSLVKGDFNNDGFADFAHGFVEFDPAFVARERTIVDVYLSDPVSGVLAPTRVDLGVLIKPDGTGTTGALDIRVLDATNDGVVDLVVYRALQESTDGYAEISVLSWTAGSGVQSSTPITTGVPDSNDKVFAIGDLNGDNLPDVITAEDANPVRNIYLKGTFVRLADVTRPGQYLPPQALPGGEHLLTSLIFDANNDGAPDLFAASFDRDFDGGIFYGTPGVPLQFPQSANVVRGGSIERGYLDSDLDPDLIDIESSALLVKLSGIELTAFASFSGTDVVVGDLNGDLLADLLMFTEAAQSTAQVASNVTATRRNHSSTSPGEFAAAVGPGLSLGAGAQGAVIVDIDGDRINDIVVASYPTRNQLLLTAISNPVFRTVNVSNATPTPTANFGSKLVDINLDGIPDAVQPATRLAITAPNASGESVSLESKAARFITSFTAPSPVTVAPPFGSSFVGSSFDFTASGFTAGSTGEFTIVVHSATPVNSYIKFDPVTSTWSNFAWNGTTGARFGVFDPLTGTTEITLTITDGGRGDSDGVANGIIADPGAAAFFETPVTSATIDGDRSTPDANAFTFTDADGNQTTVSINGPGFVDISLTGGALAGADIDRLTLRNTDPARTTVTVTVKPAAGTDNETSIGGIRGTGAKAILARASDLLAGGIELTTALQRLDIDDVADDATLAVGTTLADRFTLQADQIGEVSLTAGYIQGIKAAAWLGEGITAVAARTIQIAGVFNADLTLTGDSSQKQAIASFKAAGATGSTIAVTGSVGTLDLGGTVDDLILSVSGDVKVLRLGSAGVAAVTAGRIGSLSAIQWIDGTLTARQIKSLASTGDRAAVAGDFGVDVSITGDGVEKTLDLTNGSFAGSVTGLWNVSGAVGGLAAGSTGSGFHAGILGKLKSLTTRIGGFTGFLAAEAIGSVNIRTEVVNATLLAGSQADRPNSVGTFRVGGAFSNSVMALGLRPGNDGVLGTDDDQHLNAPIHAIKSLQVAGQTTGAPAFVAGRFPKSVRIAGQSVNPDSDGRFAIPL